MSDRPTISETFRIPALDCPDEAALVRGALARVPGIVSTSPDYLERTLRVEFHPDEVDREAIIKAISGAGLAVETDTASTKTGGAAGRRGRFASMAAGGALLVAAVVARLAVGETTTLVAVLAVVATCAASVPIVPAAWRAVRVRVLDIYVLMTVAAVGAVGIGDYFEAATAMFLFNIALWLETFAMDRARRTIRSLVALAPGVAHRLDPGGPTDVDPAELRLGDRVLVRPGERVPIDGTVLSGVSAVNQSPITGESVPVEKEPGDRLFAGSLNGEGSLEVRADRTAEATTLAHIARLVAQARATRSPTERLVDRFARRYTPAVIALAAVTGLGPPLLRLLGAEAAWLGSAGATEWFRRGLVLLVVSCPCALVISTPVTIISGLFRGARRGMLIKGGDHLENAARIDCMALDKTGTLTAGQPKVVGVEALGPHSADDVLRVAALLECHSEHPLAAAIASEARQRGLDLASQRVLDFAALRGFGVRGTLDGVTFYVGSPRLFRREGLGGGPGVPATVAEGSDTLALLGTRDAVWGAIRLADPPRADAAAAVAELKRLGVRPIVMLTGDSRAVAERIGQRLGLDEVHAELLPEDKVARTRELAARYPHLAMVGDGVNDAPALAASRLGIALGSEASDTALETADVVVMTPQVGRLPELIRLGRRCRRILLENIYLALSIKAAVLLLAAAGLATMWMAVAADVGASILVIFNGLRLAAGPATRD